MVTGIPRASHGILETKDLFSSEHGPSGEYLTFSNDKINIIKKGGNYGWPEVIAAAGKKKYTDPLIVWKTTTPPSGMTFYRGDKIGNYGRLRDVVEGPDGFLYFLTNNRDGRGTPKKSDDKIYRIVPK